MMMKPQARASCSSARSSRLLPPTPSSSVILRGPSFLNILIPRPVHHHLPATKHCLRKNNCIRATSSSSKSAPSTTTTDLEAEVTIKAVVTVQETAANLLSTLSLTAPLDSITDFVGKTFLLELVSADLDPSKLAS